MYGLVNRAIEQLVTSHKGEVGWQRVCQRAGVDADGFVSMHAYDDTITYRLVDSVSKELGIPAAQVLEAFGEYWILYTAEEGYGELLRSTGSTLQEFLGNLNDMHGRVENVFPHMRLPHFRLESGANGELRVYYSSSREGLAPMVTGLLRGLAQRFDQKVEIQRPEEGSPVNGEHLFVVRPLQS